MNQPRILLAVEPRLLRDALHTLLVRRGGLTVIDAEPGNLAILVAARRRRIDMVVATFEPTSETPPLVTHLLAELPELRVMAIDVDERCARIYRNDAEVRLVPDLTASAIIREIVLET